MDGARIYNNLSDVLGNRLLKIKIKDVDDPQKEVEFNGSIRAEEDEQLKAIKDQFIELVNMTRKLVGDAELRIRYRGYEVLYKLKCAFGGKDKFLEFCENNNIYLKMENIEFTTTTYTLECVYNKDFFDDDKDYCLINYPKEKRVYGFKNKLKPYDKRRLFKVKNCCYRIRNNTK